MRKLARKRGKDVLSPIIELELARENDRRVKTAKISCSS